MNTKKTRNGVVAVLAALALAAMSPQMVLPSSPEIASISGGGSSVAWTPFVRAERIVLTVSQPNGDVYRAEFEAGESPSYEISMDGRHQYELRIVPFIDEETRQLLDEARHRGDDTFADRLREAGVLPAGPTVQSGTFTASGGALVNSELPEASAGGSKEGVESRSGSDVESIQPPPEAVTFNDSLCVGFDCPASPAFGFSTILMMENNLRVRFDDTSNSASFPNRDWELTANDTANGGANKFSITDITGARTPFTVEAGARNNALYVEDDGDIGIGTSTPAVDIHNVTGNTPTLRLAQDGSSGFTPQSWDVAGNETNFFVRDATNGSTLPFRIRPGAPSDSLFVEGTTGDIGVGTASPEAALAVRRTNGTAQVRVEEASSTTEGRTMFDLYNNGNVRFFFTNTDSGDIWQMSVFGSSFQISSPSSSRGKFRVLENGGLQALDGTNMLLNLNNAGTLTVASVIQTSSRDSKTGFAPISSLDVLDRVAALPISEWSYKQGSPAVRHIGPMAEDFRAAFGLGSTSRGINTVDTSGVALAAIQGLNQKLEIKNARIEELESRLAELEALVLSLAGN